MMIAGKKLWSAIGVSGLLALLLCSNLIYMNLRSADPILPGWEEYDAHRFADLMTRDAPILVEIYAPWCPTCKLQYEAFEALHDGGKAPGIRAVRVDFDQDKEFVDSRGFRSTGTLVIYQRGREITRATGLVTPDKILEFLAINGVD